MCYLIYSFYDLLHLIPPSSTAKIDHGLTTATVGWWLVGWLIDWLIDWLVDFLDIGDHSFLLLGCIRGVCFVVVRGISEVEDDGGQSTCRATGTSSSFRTLVLKVLGWRRRRGRRRGGWLLWRGRRSFLGRGVRRWRLFRLHSRTNGLASRLSTTSSSTSTDSCRSTSTSTRGRRGGHGRRCLVQLLEWRHDGRFQALLIDDVIIFHHGRKSGSNCGCDTGTGSGCTRSCSSGGWSSSTTATAHTNTTATSAITITASVGTTTTTAYSKGCREGGGIIYMRRGTMMRIYRQIQVLNVLLPSTLPPWRPAK